MPVFGRGIKVDQEFASSRTVYHYDSGETTSNRVNRRDVSSERRRTRSRSRTRGKSRRRSESNSIERIRRSLSRQRHTRSGTRRYRSRSRESRYSSERHNHRDRPSKSRSRSPRSVSRHRGRSITPLRPGEYRPGHPDLALRKERRRIRISHSRSPR